MTTVQRHEPESPAAGNLTACERHANDVTLRLNPVIKFIESHLKGKDRP